MPGSLKFPFTQITVPTNDSAGIFEKPWKNEAFPGYGGPAQTLQFIMASELLNHYLDTVNSALVTIPNKYIKTGLTYICMVF